MLQRHPEALGEKVLQHLRRLVFGGTRWNFGGNVESSGLMHVFRRRPIGPLDLVALNAISRHDQLLEWHTLVSNVFGIVRSRTTDDVSSQGVEVFGAGPDPTAARMPLQTEASRVAPVCSIPESSPPCPLARRSAA